MYSSLPLIFYQMRNPASNQDILGFLPHFEYLGMLVTYRYLPCGEYDFQKSRPLYKEFCEEYQLTLKELNLHADESLNHFCKPCLYKLSDFAEELRSGVKARDYFSHSSHLPPDVYLCTNQFRYYGAQFLYSNDTLSHIALALADRFYILPSSIHEFLLLPVSLPHSAAFLRDTLRTLNSEEISSVNTLSGDILYYDAGDKTLSVYPDLAGTT